MPLLLEAQTGGAPGEEEGMFEQRFIWLRKRDSKRLMSRERKGWWVLGSPVPLGHGAHSTLYLVPPACRG